MRSRQRRMVVAERRNVYPEQLISVWRAQEVPPSVAAKWENEV